MVPHTSVVYVARLSLVIIPPDVSMLIVSPCPALFVQVPLMSSQLVVEAEAGGGGVGAVSDSGGDWYTGELVTGSCAGSTITVPSASQGPAYPEPEP
jgi:hypothetical protein